MKIKSPLLVTILSIFLNFLLFGLKLWAGMVSSSTALIADAWQTLSDSVASLAVLVGIKYSLKPADKNHPLGHGRAELIASLLIGMIMTIIGFNFLRESVLNLIERDPFQFGPLAIWVTVFSLILKEVMARYSIFFGKKFKLNSLVADGLNHRSDVYCNAAILFGILFGGNFWWIDSLLGLMVSILIFYTTYTIFKHSISVLMGEGVEPSQEDDIINLGKGLAGNLWLDPHHFIIHHYGNHSELTFHITLPGNFSLERAHEIASKYEDLVQEKLKVNCTIHVDSGEFVEFG